MIRSYAISQVPRLLKFFSGNPFRQLRIAVWRGVGFDINWSANVMASAQFIFGDIEVGESTFIGDEVLITGGRIKIGSHCDIAPRVVIHAGTHELANAKRRAGRDIAGLITIGDGCWIGTASIIIHGAVLEDGCIVAAGSVVKKGVYPKNSLLAGNPARVIKEL